MVGTYYYDHSNRDILTIEKPQYLKELETMPKGKPLTEKEKAEREKAKAAKFAKLGTARLNKALKAINALVPLANRAQYSYNDEQVTIIKKTLREAVEHVENAYAGKAAAVEGVTL